jgi:hypothetical protein
MARGHVRYLVGLLVLSALMGCRVFDYEEREPWRAQAEAQCLAEQRLQPSSFVAPSAEINGKGTCGMTRPLQVAAVSQGFVSVAPKATLACPIVAGVEAWFEEAVQPMAFAWFGEHVVEIRQISAYSCRTMNGQRGAPISEHSFGNALDIATFKLESGREVRVEQGWKGPPEEKGFLRNIHAAACERFTTVLAPGADIFHYNHIHVDLSRRASDRAVCKPEPQFIAPPSRPRVLEGVPVARAPAAPASRTAMDSPWQSKAAAPAQTRGPAVIERAPAQHAGGAAGAPLVLGPQAPSANSFGAPLSLEERLIRTFGDPTRPGAPRPPAGVPQANAGADPVVTGTIPGKRGPSEAADFDLMSPHSITGMQRFNSEPASVFDPPHGKTGSAGSQ